VPFQSFHIPRWTRGATLIGEPDAIPDDALRHAVNVRLDRTLGIVEARPGWTLKTAVALSGSISYISKLFSTSLTYAYAQVSTSLYRLTSLWVAPTLIATIAADTLSDANSPDGNGHLLKYFVNSTTALKDDGTTTTTMGIAPPTAAPTSAALATDLKTTIDAMNNAASWTGSGLSAGPADDTTQYQENGNSVSFSIAASTFGSIAQFLGGVVNLDTLTGGDNLVKDDDYIFLWVRADRPERVTFMQVDVDVDSTSTGVADSFRHNYYSVRLGGTITLSQGINEWTKVQIRKSSFARYGTDTSRSWAHARGFRIGFLTNSQGTVAFNVDDFKLRGGVGIEGDIEYTVTYRNSSTGARGNPPKDSDGIVQYTTAITTDRQRINLTTTNVIQGGANHPGDAQIDKLMIWRRGSAFTTAVLVDTISDTVASPYLDDNSDATLVLTNKLLETDNDVPPTGTTRIVFGPDATGHFFMIVNGYRLYISKPYEDTENRVENWPALGFALVGDGSSRAVAGIATATQIRVWTTERTYNVVGVGQDTFLPVAIEGSRGAVGKDAVTAGDGVIFFVAQDGIYIDVGGRQSKLTAAIDPFFQGLTVEGQAGLGVPLSTTKLRFLHQPKGSLLVMTYSTGFLVLKPNLQNAQLTECFFSSSTKTTLASLYTDTLNLNLLAGCDDGNVYQIEDETTYNDAGTSLSIQMRTKSYDFGDPQHLKYVASAVFEGQTNGQNLTLNAYYDRATIAQSVSTTVNTSSEIGLVPLPVQTPDTRRRDVALEIIGTVSQRIAITRLGCLYEPQPELQTYMDSGIISFDFVQQLKRFEADINLQSQSTLVVYADGVVVFNQMLVVTSGRVNMPIYLPAGMRGRYWRITLTASSSAFLCYHWSGFFKQLGTDQQYIERVMVQGV
jgi:hypothetical protein